MSRFKKVAVITGAAAALGAGGAAVAGAVGSESGENAGGPGAAQAEKAALAITGGRANSVERDSENGATWEVEVTKPDGRTVDVRLDQNYQRVVIEGDGDSAGDTGS